MCFSQRRPGGRLRHYPSEILTFLPRSDLSFARCFFSLFPSLLPSLFCLTSLSLSLSLCVFLFLSLSRYLPLRFAYREEASGKSRGVSDFRGRIDLATLLVRASAGDARSTSYPSVARASPGQCSTSPSQAAEARPFLSAACREERRSRWKLGYRVASAQIPPPFAAPGGSRICASRLEKRARPALRLFNRA